MKLFFGRFLQAFSPSRQQVITLAPGEYAEISVSNAIAINFVSELPCEYALIKTPSEDAEADFLAAGGRMLCLGSVFGIHKSIEAIAFKNPNGVQTNIFIEYME